MTQLLTFSLVTPERTLYHTEAAAITLPTSNGEITILPGHEPLVATLTDGVATLRHPDGREEDIAVAGGTIRIMEDGRVTVMAEMAERGADLDLDAIEKAKKMAEDILTQTDRASEEQFAQTAAMLNRELAKYRAAVKHRSRHGHITHTPETGS